MSTGILDRLRPRNIVFLAAACVLLGVLIERLWVTDGERIEALLDRAATLAGEGGWTEAAGLLDPDGVFDGMTRDEVARALRDAFDNQPLRRCSLVEVKIEILEGGEASATVRAWITPPQGMLGDRPLLLDMELSFKKRDDLGWVISAFKLLG